MADSVKFRGRQYSLDDRRVYIYVISPEYISGDFFGGMYYYEYEKND